MPAGDGRGTHGGRAPVLDEAVHEAAAYDVDARTYHAAGLRNDSIPGVAPGGGEGGATDAYGDAAAFLWGRENGARAASRGRFWAREPTATGRMLERNNTQARACVSVGGGRKDEGGEFGIV